MMVSEEEPHCLRPNVIERDGKAARALGTLLGQNPKSGKDLFLDRKMVGRIRHAFAAGTAREACEDCEWSGLCSAVAGTDFDEMYLFPSPEGTQSKDLE